VLLADIEMPLLTGLDVAAELHRRESKTRVIIVTTFARPGYLRRAMDAGVAGYLLKDRPVEELVAAVRTVHAGGRAIDPSLAVHAWTEPDPLTAYARCSGSQAMARPPPQSAQCSASRKVRCETISAKRSAKWAARIARKPRA